MKKIVALVAALLVFGGAGSALAWSVPACTSITQYLSRGSKGAQVSELQRFLVAQNYPGGGSWMVTGTFGAATQTAVRNFQQTQGLATTGFVDASTQDAIRRVSCGTSGTVPASSLPVIPINTNPFSYPYTNGYNYSYPYQYQTGTLALTSLSQNTGFAGNSITVYGTGFDAANNTVWLGSTPVYNVSSYNGTALSFTVPYTLTGNNTTVSLTVQNSRGTSNGLSFTLNPINVNPCYSSTWGSGNCGCGGYSNCAYAPISLSYLAPQSGSVGSSVTVYGAGFSTTGNTVHFGTGIVTNLSSPDGRSISFIVPSQLSGYGTQILTLGTYGVSVTNARGETSNSLPFTVTSTNGSGSGTPVISSVSGPSNLTVNTSGTWVVTMSVPSSSYTTMTVNWGDGSTGNSVNALASNVNTSGSQTFSFSHAYTTSGTYTITFTANNQYGAANVSTVTVIVSSSNTGSIGLYSISPNSGRVGTQVVLSGSGFTSDNMIHFGIGGLQHAYSANGTTIYFTIPSYMTPCDVAQGTYCTMIAQQVTAGTYPVYVTNQNGTTQTLSFVVTN